MTSAKRNQIDDETLSSGEFNDYLNHLLNQARSRAVRTEVAGSSFLLAVSTSDDK